MNVVPVRIFDCNCLLPEDLTSGTYSSLLTKVGPDASISILPLVLSLSVSPFMRLRLFVAFLTIESSEFLGDLTAWRGNVPSGTPPAGFNVQNCLNTLGNITQNCPLVRSIAYSSIILHSYKALANK